MQGEEHPHWQGGKRSEPCAVCDEVVERHPGAFVGDTTLCSRKCHREWLSEAFTGDGHPNWKGGPTGPYGPKWGPIRRQALERDEYRCVVCGTTKEELGRNPDVHHIVPVRWFDQSEEHEIADAHTLDNVVSLCIDCHRKADVGNISSDRLRVLARRGSDPAEQDDHERE